MDNTHAGHKPLEILLGLSKITTRYTGIDKEVDFCLVFDLACCVQL